MDSERSSGDELKVVDGYYIWSPAGSPVTVRLAIELVDRLSAEIMTGFGTLPRRGAEVGGILVGAIQGNVVRVDDFVPVPCEHRRGPSYLFSETDLQGFLEAFERVKFVPGKLNYAIGHYRSHTRDTDALGGEDYELMNEHFPPPSHVLLLIKPYTTKVSTAGFHVYEGAKLQPTSPLEFPFRSYELLGEEPPARRALWEMKSRRTDPEPPPDREDESEIGYEAPEPSYQPEDPPRAERPQRNYFEPLPPGDEQDAEAYAITTAPQPRARRKGWIWFPLSFVFLLLGVLLGLQAALTFFPRTNNDSPFTLSLGVTRVGDNIHLQWNRQAPAIRAARQGTVRITDGKAQMTRHLEHSELENGGLLIYQPQTDHVVFRLELQIKDETTFTETADWKAK
jgi:hypothetical protein